jgi:hypothetical protein
MGVWEYGSMGMKGSFSNLELTTLLFIFLIRLINFSAKVSHSHTPLPAGRQAYSHTVSVSEWLFRSQALHGVGDRSLNRLKSYGCQCNQEDQKTCGGEHP